jgi:hypothetical protein
MKNQCNSDLKLTTSYVLLMAVSSLIVLSACSLAEDTVKTTKEMNETTKDLKDTSNDLKDRTISLESKMTYKESYATMVVHLDRLFQETSANNKGMIDSLWEFFFGKNQEPDLFADAAFTILAMHFQFWEGQIDQDIDELDRRLETGSELLFDRLFKHITRDPKVDVLRPNLSYRALAALGAKMDEVHHRYERGLVRRGLPRMTFYDYVVQALRNRDAFARTEVLPRAAAKILQWEPEAVYLLQLRHNIFPLMVLARLTDFQDRKDLMRIWMWWRGQKVDLAKVNPEQLKEWTIWLKKAKQTRKDLREMGIEPEYNSTFNQLLESVDFGQKQIMAKTDPSAREMIMRDFAAAYISVIQEAKPVVQARPVEDQTMTF